MFSLFKIFKKEPNKTEKMCYMEIIEDYSKEYNTEPNYVEDFSK